MDNPEHDPARGPSDRSASVDAPGSGAAAGHRKPRIEVLRADSTAATGAGVANSAIPPLDNSGARTGYAAAPRMAPVQEIPARPAARRIGRWPLLLLAAVLFLILVAALSSVAFSPGREEITKSKVRAASTPRDTTRDAPSGAAPVETPDTVAPADTPSTVPSGSTSVTIPEVLPRSDESRSTERSRPERPVIDVAPRSRPAAPTTRDAPPADYDPPADDQGPPPGDEEGALRTAREFYAALGAGDGAAAAQYVIPSKRQTGPLSAGALTRYYSNLERPMRLRRATPLDGRTVRVSYDYVLLDGRLCPGQAILNVVQTNDRPLISSIRALGPC